ncbi:BREX system Lon protease-like protein BrxL [Clostridium sardiniense]|uniref:BREX system Lon protease-like protein BrxL n=1 Tax=Clostridium sardiniense TaxID=29369 RepID=A0ABS7L1W2_CLOSR|nr:BREX system Lon protease-like protein BrxL [Clostridium sardiniense]MBY0756828.1 BREX system Lon protease-like protein BrxL [Clostridium sardiniense]MDQ0458671.1 putative ATP-dependent Lon-type protease [Clostridium sardiniense]
MFYVPQIDSNDRGEVWMRDFKPFQVAFVDIDYYKELIKKFSIDEWLDLIISSMGFNPNVYSE